MTSGTGPTAERFVNFDTGQPQALRDATDSVFGASGTDHAAGLVPDPGSSAGSTRFLCENGLFSVPAGGGGGITALTGDVTASGPGSAAATIASGAVSLAKMANLAADSVIGNNTASPATPIALTQAQLTALVNVATISDSGAVPTLPNDATKFLDGTGNFSTPATVGVWTPGGRLTYLTGTPAPITSASGVTTIFYTPYFHRFVPIWNGSSFTMTDIGGELSQLLTDTTKSPAAAAASSLYDVFVWNDSGTIQATRGPAWSSSSSRGTGAGTTELIQIQGVQVNANAITNGPAANFGTYVGTFLTDGSGTFTLNFGGSASGGSAAMLAMYNYYNRILQIGRVFDTGVGYTYSSATVRPARNSTGNRITFVLGFQEDGAVAMYNQSVQFVATNGSKSLIGIGLNSTSAFNQANDLVAQGTGADILWGTIVLVTSGGGIGTNFIQALEQGDGTHGNTFDASPSFGSELGLWYRM